MIVERREPAIDVWFGSTGDRKSPHAKRKAAAFSRSHEPCKSRGLRTICERLAVRFRGPTRRLPEDDIVGQPEFVERLLGAAMADGSTNCWRDKQIRYSGEHDSTGDLAVALPIRPLAGKKSIVRRWLNIAFPVDCPRANRMLAP